MSKFHYRDGLYFERLEDGSVRITRNLGHICWDIDRDSWASIIAHVSAGGETADTFQEAMLFHAGQEKQTITGKDVGKVEDIL